MQLTVEFIEVKLKFVIQLNMALLSNFPIKSLSGAKHYWIDSLRKYSIYVPTSINVFVGAIHDCLDVMNEANVFHHAERTMQNWNE